jgi:hypothetical protein
MLIDDVRRFVRRFIFLDEDQTIAVALWIIHTHAFDALGITPYLSITSAEKRSGKTHLLELLNLLVAKPWMSGDVTAATLVRKIDQQRPTLLLDESDATFKGGSEYAETLRGVLNTGFRSSGTFSRCVGASATSLTVKDFSTFCAKAIAGIGTLPDTVADRSILIRMKRKAPHEQVERWRERKVPLESEGLRDRIARWAEEHDEHLAGLDLAPLDELSDRAADVWEPLLGIAYVAGEDSFRRARKAAIALSGRRRGDDGSHGVRLLADIRMVFDQGGVLKLMSATLVEALNGIEESPWAEWQGKPLTKNGLARLLKPHEIRPHTIRLGDATGKGYSREQFEEAWIRFVGSPENVDPPSVAVTPSQLASLSERAARTNRHGAGVSDPSEVTAVPHEHTDVTAVTVQRGPSKAVPARDAYPGGEKAVVADLIDMLDARLVDEWHNNEECAA